MSGLFYIKFKKNFDSKRVFGEKCLLGEIKISSFIEELSIPIDYWEINAYLDQWKFAITSILNGRENSYLVTQMRNPYKFEFISIWPIFKEKDKAFIRNQIIFTKGNESQILNLQLSDLVNERKTCFTGNDKISEWEVSLKELEHYVKDYFL